MLKDWDDYYTHLNKTKSDVRDGCHPLIFQHSDRTRNAIVLVHGLTDSPHFMRDIGDYFCSELGFDVYLPLLQAHGLKEPQSMKDVSAVEWKKDVRFALQAAQASGGQVSIGGLSVGGALSVEAALSDPEMISGGVFLFAAALGLATQAGNIGEVFLRSLLAKLFDQADLPLIDNSPSGNPYRYAQMDLGGAGELSKLIQELDALIADRSVTQPLFAAHSEADVAADMANVEDLVKKSSRAELFRIGKSCAVSHANIVLKNPVFSANHSPLEVANPFFAEMMRSIQEFAIKHQLLDVEQPTKLTTHD
jgi:esterase/lipase